MSTQGPLPTYTDTLALIARLRVVSRKIRRSPELNTQKSFNERAKEEGFAEPAGVSEHNEGRLLGQIDVLGLTLANFNRNKNNLTRAVRGCIDQFPDVVLAHLAKDTKAVAAYQKQLGKLSRQTEKVIYFLNQCKAETHSSHTERKKTLRAECETYLRELAHLHEILGSLQEQALLESDPNLFVMQFDECNAMLNRLTSLPDADFSKEKIHPELFESICTIQMNTIDAIKIAQEMRAQPSPVSDQSLPASEISPRSSGDSSPETRSDTSPSSMSPSSSEESPSPRSESPEPPTKAPIRRSWLPRAAMKAIEKISKNTTKKSASKKEGSKPPLERSKGKGRRNIKLKS